MINEAINKLAEKQNLTGAETIGAFGEDPSLWIRRNDP